MIVLEKKIEELGYDFMGLSSVLYSKGINGVESCSAGSCDGGCSAGCAPAGSKEKKHV